MLWLYTTSENTSTLTAGSGNNFLKFSKQLGILIGHLPNIWNTGSLRVLLRDMMPTNNHIIFTSRYNRTGDWDDIVVRLFDSQQSIGGQGWRSGESVRLPPMCPGFDSGTRHHMWIEFVVGSRPCSECFSQGSPDFFPPQKPTFLNSNSIGNSRATGLSVEDCCVSPSLHKVILINLFI